MLAGASVGSGWVRPPTQARPLPPIRHDDAASAWSMAWMVLRRPVAIYARLINSRGSNLSTRPLRLRDAVVKEPAQHCNRKGALRTQVNVSPCPPAAWSARCVPSLIVISRP